MSIGVAGFIQVRLGSLVRAKVLSGSLGFAGVHTCAPWCRPVQSGSLGFTLEKIDVADR